MKTLTRPRLLRLTVASYLCPLATPPLDSAPAAPAAPAPAAGDAGGGTGGDGGTSGTGGGGDGGAAGSAPAGTGDGVFQPFFQEPAPNQAPVTPPPGAQPAGGTKPPAERSLDEFPAEIRDYIKQLRTENGDRRVEAKTAEERAAQRFEEQRQEWVASLLKATGLMPDVPDDTDGESGPAPEEQIRILTDQLTSQTADRVAMARELAIWQNASEHGANPKRLTDSRQFMRGIDSLDPSAPDFAAKVAAAIGTAVETDSYFKAEQPAGQAPPVLPPVPSGGDFAAGSSAESTEPSTVDDFRAEFRKRRSDSPG